MKVRLIRSKHRDTGDNRMSVGEAITREKILSAITSKLTSPEGTAHARKRIVERLRVSECSGLLAVEEAERQDHYSSVAPAEVRDGLAKVISLAGFREALAAGGDRGGDRAAKPKGRRLTKEKVRVG